MKAALVAWFLKILRMLLYIGRNTIATAAPITRAPKNGRNKNDAATKKRTMRARRKYVWN